MKKLGQTQTEYLFDFIGAEDYYLVELLEKAADLGVLVEISHEWDDIPIILFDLSDFEDCDEQA